MCPLIEKATFPYGKYQPAGSPGRSNIVYHCIPRLYMLIGTRFGGDGKQNFKLPDLQKSPDNMIYCVAVEGEFPMYGSRRSVFSFDWRCKLFTVLKQGCSSKTGG